ncbi:MAG TPA: hypothetical protein VLK33_03205, partial [Terriglobales bacterium]|nr:hypothetical protein [Terriglobales bacterium]
RWCKPPVMQSEIRYSLVVCVKFSKMVIDSVGILSSYQSAERVLEETSPQLDGGAAVCSSSRGFTVRARSKFLFI